MIEADLQAAEHVKVPIHIPDAPGKIEKPICGSSVGIGPQEIGGTIRSFANAKFGRKCHLLSISRHRVDDVIPPLNSQIYRLFVSGMLISKSVEPQPRLFRKRPDRPSC